MRLVPCGPSELSRQVREGGIRIKSEYFPPGTTVGTVAWANSRSQLIYGDPEMFGPERRIPDEDRGVTHDGVARTRSNFHPFAAGLGQCVGKNLAIVQLMLLVA